VAARVGDRPQAEPAGVDAVTSTDAVAASAAMTLTDRLPAGDATATALVRDLVARPLRALPAMYRPESREFVQTARRTAAGGLRPEGTSARYTALAGLGVARLDADVQRDLLAGITARELVETLADRIPLDRDLGAVALTAWAAAEAGAAAPTPLLDRLAAEIRAARTQPTVDYAWALTALVAATRTTTDTDLAAVAAQAAERLLAAQEPTGLFPHALPPETLGRFRAHVGCFADQVYPLQALARHHAATGDPRALAAANRCAAAIVDRQGLAGQWWWHYDVRTGAVLDGYPVYSVHQHAMAPMALFDLAAAGGDDHLAAVLAGLGWLRHHPETAAELLDEATGVVWRKVGRREPRKLVRSARAVASALSPRLRLRVLDRLFPPGVVDHECRPYELGWLLYAWTAAPGSARAGEEG
jgi:hypothetical protein